MSREGGVRSKKKIMQDIELEKIFLQDIELEKNIPACA